MQLRGCFPSQNKLYIMVLKIFNSSSSMQRALDYNFDKVKEEQAEIVASFNIRGTTIPAIKDAFNTWEKKNIRTKKVGFHMSVNPGKADSITEREVISLTKDVMESLGYGKQPIVIVRHDDTARTHYHVVSIRVDENGKKINDLKERKTVFRIMLQLKSKYGYQIGKGDVQEDRYYHAYPVFNPYLGDLTNQLDDIFNFLKKYTFSDFAQCQMILRDFGIGLSYEWKNGKKTLFARGLDRQGHPCTRALSGRNLIRYRNWLNARLADAENNPRPVPDIALARAANLTDYCRDRATSSLHFRNMLAKQGMSASFEKDDDRRIVGVTFIDHRLHVAFSSDKLSQLYNPISFNARINSGTWDEGDPFDFYDSKEEDASESENPHFAIGEWLIAEGRSKSLEKDPVYRKRKSLHF